ncbi:MAG: carotene 7,8-desaturase, partial [Acidobacteria bacterium]
MPQSWTQPPTVAVVGGGLAGLAAGCALASAGMKVTLFERRPYLGGRASSYQHPGTGEVIDNCQHVLLGCCTNLIDFYERTGVAGSIRWFERMTFLEPGGRASEIGPSSLPAPLHTTPAFLRASCLEVGWLNRHGQTVRAIERFWKPVLVSALNEEV